MIDRETRARERSIEIEHRVRDERAIDRAISISKERYGRVRPSRFELNHDQQKLYNDLVQWPVMRPRDIIEFRYGGNPHRYHRDLTPMAQFGLLKPIRLSNSSFVIQRADSRYKLRNAVHDAGVYEIYELYRQKINAAHCSLASTRTESQLRSEFWRKVGANPARANRAIREKAAAEMDLPVIDGKVMFPDARLEVDIPFGREWKREILDIELATGSGSYFPGAVDAKRSAGFLVSGPDCWMGGTPHGVDNSFGR